MPDFDHNHQGPFRGPFVPPVNPWAAEHAAEVVAGAAATAAAIQNANNAAAVQAEAAQQQAGVRQTLCQAAQQHLTNLLALNATNPAAVAEIEALQAILPELA